MATFLDLARLVASESGTVSGGDQPVTVTGQTGRMGKIVGWTRRAWLDIQNRRADWRWMEAEWQGALVENVSTYNPASLGAVRFARWQHETPRGIPVTTVADPALNPQDQARLRYESWGDFYTRRMQTAATPARPMVYSENGQEALVFSPAPNRPYVVRGLYRKAPQVLTLNADVPEMPERFHNLIVSVALIYLGTNDESISQLPLWNREVLRQMGELERDQLPPLGINVELYF